MKTTSLSPTLIHESINHFPSSGEWESFSLHTLQGKKTLSWKNADHIPTTEGVYAFAFPVEILGTKKYSIKLDGPRKSEIYFEFTVDDLEKIENNTQIVLYVGRTTNLLNRLQMHLRKTRTATQVLYGMKKIFGKSFQEAKDMLISSGVFYYLPVPGEINCVNRDLIELWLCVKYRSPINIKSER